MGEQSHGKQWVTPIERELEQFGMKAAGRVPLPKNIQPMLATLIEEPFDSKDWLFELKMDGVRAVVVKNGSKLDMWTRNANDLTRRFPLRSFADLPVDTVIPDGEIVALDEKGHFINLIQPRIHLRGGATSPHGRNGFPPISTRSMCCI
jgi:bifunctional non-homologous end joining protein LigD